ncbi:RteC domain-containing protein [Chryseobacterium caseinilyticum]|uniref:RteC domain-containing protein n=1 Tax=Chryseobacterium caseinilyticum TaxID=2771428 RepID=A0ABR8ZIS8_9FLAO|nr:RteC domain-containing protein [Chryseobacterium caseinilyticum]MBD8084641.1 RteC domain-containing protein [Chryseobacterium caseinilyticum]
MVQNNLLIEIHDLSQKLAEVLETLENNRENWIACCESALMKIDETVRVAKSLVSSCEFESTADEVYFFKVLKPSLISKFIYYTRILSIESLKPAMGTEVLLKYYESEQKKLNTFYKDNAEFYSYYRRGATYLDHKYFVRDSFDMKMRLSAGFYNLDSSFTTSHDHLVAHILANSKLEVYLMEELYTAKNVKPEIREYRSALSWSSSKVSLIELIYSLHLMKCFNAGNMEISEVIRTFEKMLGVDLSNFHKILGEIKLRKINRTKFLQSLHDNLEQHFTDLDGK